MRKSYFFFDVRIGQDEELLILFTVNDFILLVYVTPLLSDP